MFGQLVAPNLLFLFNPFLPGIAWHPVAFLICSHSNFCSCFRSGFHPWVSKLGCTTPAVVDGAAMRSSALFSVWFPLFPMSCSLLLFSSDLEQPRILKALEAWYILVLAILPEGLQWRQVEITWFVTLVLFSVSGGTVFLAGTVSRLHWVCAWGTVAEIPQPGWWEVQDSSGGLSEWPGLRTQTDCMVQLPSIFLSFHCHILPACLEKMPHLPLPSQAVRAAQQIWAHSSFPVLQHSPYIYSTTIPWLLVETVSCFNWKSVLTRRRSTKFNLSDPSWFCSSWDAFDLNLQGGVFTSFYFQACILEFPSKSIINVSNIAYFFSFSS